VQLRLRRHGFAADATAGGHPTWRGSCPPANGPAHKLRLSGTVGQLCPCTRLDPAGSLPRRRLTARNRHQRPSKSVIGAKSRARGFSPPDFTANWSGEFSEMRKQATSGMRTTSERPGKDLGPAILLRVGTSVPRGAVLGRASATEIAECNWYLRRARIQADSDGRPLWAERGSGRPERSGGRFAAQRRLIRPNLARRATGACIPQNRAVPSGPSVLRSSGRPGAAVVPGCLGSALPPRDVSARRSPTRDVSARRSRHGTSRLGAPATGRLGSAPLNLLHSSARFRRPRLCFGRTGRDRQA
jgi:hypothetical protein